MTTSGDTLLVVFDSIHDVVRAEKLLLAEGIACDLVPTPRDVSSDCGMVVACAPEAREAVEALAASGLQVRRMVVRSGMGLALTTRCRPE